MEKHTIRWFARMPGTDFDWTPRTASMSMASNNFGWEAKCSCGWHTKIGGAVPSHIRKLIADHKFDVKHGLWNPEEDSNGTF